MKPRTLAVSLFMAIVAITAVIDLVVRSEHITLSAGWAIWVGGLVAAALVVATLSWPRAVKKERQKARRDLAYAEARHRATFIHAGVGIAITDRDGIILSANPAMHRIVDHEGSSLKRTNGRELIHPEDRKIHDAAVRRLLTGEPVVTTEVRAAGGEERWCRISITMIDGKYSDRLFVTIVEDVTKQRQAQTELAASESKFRQLHEQAPVAIQREDYSKVVALFDELKASGVTDLGEYLASGENLLEDLLAKVAIIDLNPAAKVLQSHLDRGRDNLTLLDRLTGAARATFVETLEAIWYGKSTLEQSAESVGHDGSPRFLDIRWQAPEVNGTPDYSNVLVTMADISELRETQRRLEEMVASKDRFIASVAHELRTPLTAVVGFAQELEDVAGLYSDREKQEFRELIAFHSAELSYIIDDLLVWARGDVGDVRVSPEQVDLGEAVRVSLSSIRGADLPASEPDGPVLAYVDPGRLRQIIRNLATNAVRYGGSEASVVVRARRDHAVVEVRDDGPPLPEADMEKIFEPYTRSRTSAAAPGSIGLGLTVSRTLARIHGGDLVCVREDGYNIFRISLPTKPGRIWAGTD